ncbi:MAG TPA: hypothetical protein VFY36_09835 [Solirubrobacteraceae bacterium]|nr:hypothetical protein [Solirubrobacteraceae bacterium]
MNGTRALAPDAEIVLAIASTAMPFARTPADQAERWLRVLRLHGEAGMALQALGVSDVALAEPSDGAADEPVSSAELQDGDVIVAVSERAMDIAAGRGSVGVSTVELLLAVMSVYGDHFARVLEAHGGDCAEVLDRLGVAVPE